MQTDGDLAEQMRNATSGIASSNIGDPLPKNRPFCKGFKPHSPTDDWMRNGNLINGLSCDKGDIPISQHLDAVVGDTQEGMLEIKHFAGYVNGQDLAPTVADDLTSKCKT